MRFPFLAAKGGGEFRNFGGEGYLNKLLFIDGKPIELQVKISFVYCLFFEDWVIVDYLKSKQKLKSKDFELLIALLLKKFHERQWGCKCCIGLELQDKFSSEFSADNNATLNELHEILSRKIENDTPNDIVIAQQKNTLGDNRRSTVRKGMSYQIKRFGKGARNSTEDLLYSLQKYHRQFSKTKTNLLIILETNQEINFQWLQENLKCEDYPFEKIMFVAKANDKILLGELWPNSGMDEFNINSIIQVTNPAIPHPSKNQ